MSTADRDKILFKKRLCGKCLLPGARFNSGHDCDDTYLCKQDFVKRTGEAAKCSKHVIVCRFHCDKDRNKELLALYKINMFSNKDLPDFSKNIQISCLSLTYESSVLKVESSIYLFQTTIIAGDETNLFYDNGCGDSIINKNCADRLVSKGLARLEIPGPIDLWGVNNQKSVCEHGMYIVTVPYGNGQNAKFRAICLDEITVPFPRYPLKNVENDIRSRKIRIWAHYI